MKIQTRFLPLLALAILALLLAMWAGLVRMGWVLPSLPGLSVAHGPLMVCGFLGVLNPLERAVAIAPHVTEIPLIPATQTPVPPPPSTPTPASRSLTVCLVDELNTLCPCGSPNSAARSVLSAIYDGPIDIVEYGYEPIILEKIPNLADGDAQISPIPVKAGDQVVDASGNLVSLTTGVKVRPSSCRGDDCVIAYDGTSTLQMDQLIVTFTMLDKLMWSDGEPLTASDSVYSFQVASANATPISKFLIDRTQIYEAADDLTVQWWGKPGFIDPGRRCPGGSDLQH